MILSKLHPGQAIRLKGRSGYFLFLGKTKVIDKNTSEIIHDDYSFILCSKAAQISEGYIEIKNALDAPHLYPLDLLYLGFVPKKCMCVNIQFKLDEDKIEEIANTDAKFPKDIVGNNSRYKTIYEDINK